MHSFVIDRATLDGTLSAEEQQLSQSENVIDCGDGVELSGLISDIDPITKRPLEKPCRNKQCGHVYGLDSVSEALKINPNMRCPIMGCANKAFVTLANLVPDKELARKLYVQRATANRL